MNLTENHDTDCLKSEDNNHVYKVGDILMQIIIKLLKVEEIFNHIKQIEVSEEKKKCYDIGIELLYLRTMTCGIPYYAKFGFRPNNESDYEVFRHNRNNYKLNKNINNDELIVIIENSKKNSIKEHMKYMKNI